MPPGVNDRNLQPAADRYIRKLGVLRSTTNVSTPETDPQIALLERIAAAAERLVTLLEYHGAPPLGDVPDEARGPTDGPVSGTTLPRGGASSPTDESAPGVAREPVGSERAEPAGSGNLMDYNQVAELLGVPKGTLYNLVYENRIPHIRLGKKTVRFSRDDLEKWLQRRKVRTR